jgi:hypothetical protein
MKLIMARSPEALIALVGLARCPGWDPKDNNAIALMGNYGLLRDDAYGAPILTPTAKSVVLAASDGETIEELTIQSPFDRGH